MMKRTMKAVFLSSERATALIEEAREEGLSPTQRMRLTMHTAMCVICRNYKRMSRTMDAFFRSWSERSLSDVQMPSAKKESLLENLRKERKS